MHSNRALKWTLFAVHKQQSTEVDIVCRAQATKHSSGHCLPCTSHRALKWTLFAVHLALTAQQVGREEEASVIAASLAAAQHADGSMLGSLTTITSSTGDSLDIETTAVAVLAWLHRDDYAMHVRKAVEWMVRPDPLPCLYVFSCVLSRFLFKRVSKVSLSPVLCSLSLKSLCLARDVWMRACAGGALQERSVREHPGHSPGP